MQFDHLFERHSLVIINTASYLSWIISNGSQVIFFFLKGKIFLFYHIVSSNLFSPMRYYAIPSQLVTFLAKGVRIRVEN